MANDRERCKALGKTLGDMPVQCEREWTHSGMHRHGTMEWSDQSEPSKEELQKALEEYAKGKIGRLEWMALKAKPIPLGVGNDPVFDLTIGRLDWILSEMMILAKDDTLSDANKQTLKHHAEDMVAAGNAILKKLGKKVEGTPQPAYDPFPTV